MNGRMKRQSRFIAKGSDLRIRLPGESEWITLEEFAKRKQAEGVMAPPPLHPDDVYPFK